MILFKINPKIWRRCFMMLILKNCTCCQDFGKFRIIWHLVCTFYRNTKWYKIFVIHTHTIFKFYISWKRCSTSKLLNKKYFSWKKPKNTLELILINYLHLWGTGPLWSSGSRMLTPSTLCYATNIINIILVTLTETEDSKT